jgi:hypothetical protein
MKNDHVVAAELMYTQCARGFSNWCRDLFEGSSELRLLLCREQITNGRRSVHVVCACGIFVQHILDAVPIDKYFEMFKPGSGSDGGFVRLKMKLLTNSDMKRDKGVLWFLLLLLFEPSAPPVVAAPGLSASCAGMQDVQG